ncbi:MAG: dimethylsulfonioproprionate lyase family protein [Paracoccaceae bacterium]
MLVRNAIDPAIEAIAEVYAAEPRPEAVATALALRAALPLNWPPAPPCPMDAAIRACLANSDHPVAQAALAAQDQLSWGANPVAGQMTDQAAAICAVLTLLDPEGPIPHPGFRVGLLYMSPHSYYPLHDHDADETYVIVAGAAEWTAGPDRRWRGAGEAIHHPSHMPHAFRTGDQGMVALWRWSGDINTQSYRFLPDPDAA